MNASPAHVDRSLPAISPMMLKWFRAYARRFVKKNFHALRITVDGQPRVLDPARPIVIAMNHPSWWDPMIALVLSQQFFPDRQHFAPIDSAMLEKYRFFAKLGFFGVDSTTRGSLAFLRTAMAITRTPATCIWITAQGEFCDPRQRPVTFAAGLPRLLEHIGDSVTVLPLAIEYPFWTEREPEALVRFGESIEESQNPAAALEKTMDDLSRDAIAKDVAQFKILLGGTAGTSFIYDIWRRFKHSLSHERSERFTNAHAEDVQP